MSSPILSLCIPTNGVTELVIPVLDSIYNQNIEDNLYEVVVVNNGSNIEFENSMLEYASKKNNLVYKTTTAEGFLNQTESYKIARGEFIKFINHRMLLLPGAIQFLIDFAIANMEKKPVVYFSNGKLMNLYDDSLVCDSFDMFVSKLSYWSSWSAGIALWREDVKKFSELFFNVFFPHTDVLFLKRNNETYIIENRILLYEIPINWAFKGSYDLFNTFAVEYVAIILDLYRDGDISKKTFLKIKRDNFYYLSDRYIIYVFLRKKSSFNFTGYKDSISFFYSMWQIKLSVVRLPILVIKQLLKRIRSRYIKMQLSIGE